MAAAQYQGSRPTSRALWRTLPGPRQRCATCANLGRRLTCLEPVKACLAPRFEIVVMDPGDGVHCPAWRHWQDGSANPL